MNIRRKTNRDLEEEVAALKTRIAASRSNLARFHLLAREIPTGYSKEDYQATIDGIYEEVKDRIL
tara:strand:- start:558 stop:752 length:195 start_codon:yes stop_codon:yes gene_type:complete